MGPRVAQIERVFDSRAPPRPAPRITYCPCMQPAGDGADVLAAEGDDRVATRGDGRGSLVRAARRPWPALRLALVLVWSVIAVATLLSPRATSASELFAAVEQGRVDRVGVAGGLEAGWTGSATVEVTWRGDGGLPRRTRLVEVRPDVGGTDGADGIVWSEGDAPLTQVADVVAEVRSYSSDVQVERVPVDDGLRLFGVPVAPWGALLGALAWLSALWVLVNGPQPWRATRWAWFWLSAPPLGMLAFLVLSGPLPGRGRRRPEGPRLTGGWAFLLTLLIGAVLPAPLWWATG